MIKYSTIIILLFYSYSAATQNSFTIENHIQQIISIGDEVENRAYYDLLLFYYDNPIDINRATESELSQLAFLTEAQIATIVKHREETGHYKSIYELQALDGLALETIKMLIPFITLVEHQLLMKNFTGAFQSKNNYITTAYSKVLQPSRGYKDQIYAGSPDRAQFRLRVRNPGKLSIGLSAQKDPGELWLSQNMNYMPDHITGHIYLENQKRLNQLVVGDYRLQYGQGLLLGAGFMAGKNVEAVTSVKQSSLGITPYSSISETKYFRGVAANLAITDKLRFSLFYSNQGLDATATVSTSRPAVSALRASGLHRTLSEIESINQINEQVWGTTVIYRGRRLSTGAALMTTQFNKPIVPANVGYNKYSFNGRELSNYSWFGQYNVGNFLLFGEIAKTHMAGMASSIGVIASLSKSLSLSFLYRKFDKDFHSFYGQSFSERSKLNNEEGLYWGIKITPVNKLTILAYFDVFKFSWLTASTSAPYLGKDYLLRVEYLFSKASSAFLQVRNKNQTEKEHLGPVAMDKSAYLVKTIINFDFAKESALSYRTRVQHNSHSSNNDGSWLIFQDVNYNNMKFGVTARVLMFDVPTFRTRQYVYEKDMLFTYLTRGFSGKGISYYLIVKYKPHSKVSLRFKWSLTEYLNQTTIGSGYDLINGNLRTQLTGQLYLRF